MYTTILSVNFYQGITCTYIINKQSIKSRQALFFVLMSSFFSLLFTFQFFGVYISGMETFLGLSVCAETGFHRPCYVIRYFFLLHLHVRLHVQHWANSLLTFVRFCLSGLIHHNRFQKSLPSWPHHLFKNSSQTTTPELLFS